MTASPVFSYRPLVESLNSLISVKNVSAPGGAGLRPPLAGFSRCHHLVHTLSSLNEGSLSRDETTAYVCVHLLQLYPWNSEISHRVSTVVWRGRGLFFCSHTAASRLAPGPNCIIFPFNWSFALFLPLCCESDSLPELWSWGAIEIKI